MAVSRRRLLVLAVAAPVAAFLARGAGIAAEALAAAAGAARPSADGTSATRCAQCGSPDHTMLDASCPMAPRVLA